METTRDTYWYYKGFDIVGGNLKDALKVAFRSGFSDDKMITAAGWSVEEREGKPTRLILHEYPHTAESTTHFISPIDYRRAAKLVGDWLKTVAYPREPDIDGSTAMSHRVYCEGWGDRNAFVAIEPRWLLYGK